MGIFVKEKEVKFVTFKGDIIEVENKFKNLMSCELYINHTITPVHIGEDKVLNLPHQYLLIFMYR